MSFPNLPLRTSRAASLSSKIYNSTKMSNQPTYTSPNGTVYIAGGKDANCTLSVCPVEYSVYGYRPSIEASTILIGLFSLCMVVQVYLGRRYHAWGYTSAICLGCVDEILGYVGRILLYQNPWNNAGFIMQIGKLQRFGIFQRDLH